MAEKFNREVTFTLREIDGASVGAPAQFFGSEIGKEEEDNLPYEISASIRKSMTSNSDQCTLKITNFIALEKFYEQPDVFLEEYSQKDYILTVFLGYSDFVQVFSGDLTDIAVTGGSSINDQAIILTATVGERALSRGRIKQKFSAGQSFQDLVDKSFEALLPFGVELVLTDDPLDKLKKELKKPRTEDRAAGDVLNDICRELDMTWGIDSRQTQTDNNRAYFVDKKSSFDVHGLFGKGIFDVGYETGLIGLPSFSKSQFRFTHRYDKHLNVGIAINLSVKPQINTDNKILGRISAVDLSATNKNGEYNYMCTADFAEEVGGVVLAKLNNDRRNVGAELQ